MRLALTSSLLVSGSLLVFLALSVGAAGVRLPWQLDSLVWELRAPRVALAAILGASLAIAGLGMQALLHNDLADPYILGLSGGASAGSVASLALWPNLPQGPGAALGALGAASLVRLLSRGAFDPTRLLLSGVSVGSLLSGTTGLILILAPGSQLLRGSVYWLFGGLCSPSWSTLLLPLSVLALAFAWMRRRAERLDRLTLGEEVAAALGVNVRQLQRGLLLMCVVLTATSVALGGLIGFVGLMAPHLARRLVGGSHRECLPIALLSGALLMVVADLLARSAFAPREVPVGLVTAAVGGPFFLWQLQRGAG